MTPLVDKASKGKVAPDPPLGRWILGNFFVLIRQYGKSLIVGTCVCYLGHEVRTAIVAFAGHTSVARLFAEVAGHFNVSVDISLALTGLTTVLWGNEYRRHLKTREQLTARITTLEKAFDKNRTSSLLTSKGLTAPGDQ